MSPPTPALGDSPVRGLNLSFAGCGFLGIYHVGVSACLRKCAPQLGIQSIAGASAGAMAAACLLSNANLGVIRATIVRAAAEARVRTFGPFSLKFDLQQRLKDGLTQVLPANAHQLVSGRLFVSMTRVSDGKNVILSHFDTREELVQVLLCSSFIPVFSGVRPITVRGVRYMDGGFTNNQPVQDDATVTVSPFSGEADICPRDGNTAGLIAFSMTNSNFQINSPNIQRFVHAVFPPSPDHLHQVCQQGFNDTLDFLQRNDLISCTRCPALISSLSLPSISRAIANTNSTSSTRLKRNNRSERDLNADRTRTRRVGPSAAAGDVSAGGTTTAAHGVTSHERAQSHQGTKGSFYLDDEDDLTYQSVIRDAGGTDGPEEAGWWPLDELQSSLQRDPTKSQDWARSCVNCPDCRQYMQEAVMNDNPPMTPDQVHPDHERLGLMVHPPPRSSTRHVVRIMVLPVTLSVRIPLRIVNCLVSLLPAVPARLGLQTFSEQMTQLVRTMLLSRRRAVASERHAAERRAVTHRGSSGVSTRGTGGGSLTDAVQGPASHRKSPRRSPRHPASPQSGPCLYVCFALPGGSESSPVLWDAHSLMQEVKDASLPPLTIMEEVQ